MDFENAAPQDNGLTPSRDRSEGAPGPAGQGAMWYRISAEQGYLRAELFGRKTVEETRRFLDAVVAEGLKHQRARLLIYARNSKPIFTLERYGFSRYLEIAFRSAYKIALMGDSLELRIAHQYIATQARLRGVNLLTFLDETAAIEWLRSDEMRSRASWHF